MRSTRHVDGQSVTLLDLPPELISSICLSSAEWRIIFALEQVCTVLNGILSERNIWAHLVSTCLYPPNFGPRICFLSRSITTYTTSELRALFVRWKKVEIGWQHADERTFKARKLDHGQFIGEWHYVLSPGGRWVISFESEGSAHYFDLDSQIFSPISLIPSPTSGLGTGSCTPVHVSNPCVDKTAPGSRLSFHFAVTYTDGSETLHMIQVWKISSVYDVDTKAEALAADKISELKVDLDCEPVFVHALRGDMMLLITRTFGDMTYLLVNWRKATDNAQEPSCRILRMDLPLWAGEILENAVLLRSARGGEPIWTTYQDVPQFPLAELRQHYPASAASELNYGKNFSIQAQRCISNFSDMSRAYYGYDSALRTVRTVLVAGDDGNYFAVVYFGDDTRTPGSPLLACIPIGNDETSIFDSGIMGRAVGVFNDGNDQWKVALYPDVLSAIDKKLSKSEGRNCVEDLTGDDAFQQPQLVTIRNLPGVAGDTLHTFDEGTGRLLISDEEHFSVTVVDMIV